MCGIAGAILFNGKTEKDILKKMAMSLIHRGPDNQNVEQYNVAGVDVGFAHTRLSIIDLTDAAKQPMSFEQFTIVFNGEIYNFKEIRSELIKLGHQFHTQSDTEVILHAFYQWGKLAIDKFIGMFAFVILDKLSKKFYLFRDRAGVKPLHYYWDNFCFLFGSELKALIKHPRFIKQINEESLGYYFKMGYVPSPLTIYKKTFKINPGHFAVLDLISKNLKINQYWNSSAFYQKPKLKISYQEAKEEVEQLLISSCNYRMVSDVPVGVFLSGGYDSTAVTAILQKGRTEKLKTFTIGFEEGNNEAPHAKKTAKYLGTEHYEYICSKKDAQDIIPKLPYYFDEPFFDSSAIPTYLVSSLARPHVKVALSADGGDEIFAGYPSYPSLERNMNLLGNIKFIDNKLFGKLLINSSGLLKSESFLAQKMHYLGFLLNSNSEFRASLLQEGVQSLSFKVYEKLMISISYPKNLLLFNQNLFEDPITVGQAVDYNSYFHNDILTKVDRASMATSLESREPMVDHRLFEFVAQLPVKYKYSSLLGKKILKDIVHDYVPKKMMDRPKSGFSLPISLWLREDLSYLLDEFLNKKSIDESGYLNSEYVSHIVKLFNNKNLYDESLIWKILQFQMWYKLWM